MACIRNNCPIIGGEDGQEKRGENFACIFQIASCRRFFGVFLDRNKSVTLAVGPYDKT